MTVLAKRKTKPKQNGGESPPTDDPDVKIAMYAERRAKRRNVPTVDAAGLVVLTSQEMIAREFGVSGKTVSSWVGQGMPMLEDGTFQLRAVLEWWIFNKLPSKWQMIVKIFDLLPGKTRNRLLAHVANNPEQERHPAAPESKERKQISESELELKKQRLQLQNTETQLKLDERRGVIIAKEHVERLFTTLQSDLVQMGELQRKHFGPDAQQLVTDALDAIISKVKDEGFLQ